MGRCSFGGYANINGPVVSYFKFPTNADQCSKWTRVVKSTRTDWKGPKPYSVVCSEHFDDNSFEGGRQSLVLAARFGLSRRPKLKADALPLPMLVARTRCRWRCVLCPNDAQDGRRDTGRNNTYF